MEQSTSSAAIKAHFLKFLGADVAIDVSDPSLPRSVTLYRRDRLSDDFVMQAFNALATSSPELAGEIGHVVVSYQSRLGKAQRLLGVGYLGTETAEEKMA